MWPALVHVRHVHALIYVKTPEGRRMCVCVTRAEFTNIDGLLRSAINVDLLNHIHQKTYSIRIYSLCLVLVIDLATILKSTSSLLLLSIHTPHKYLLSIMLSRYRIVSKTRFFCNFLSAPSTQSSIIPVLIFFLNETRTRSVTMNTLHLDVAFDFDWLIDWLIISYRTICHEILKLQIQIQIESQNSARLDAG